MALGRSRKAHGRGLTFSSLRDTVPRSLEEQKRVKTGEKSRIRAVRRMQRHASSSWRGVVGPLESVPGLYVSHVLNPSTYFNIDSLGRGVRLVRDPADVATMARPQSRRKDTP